MYFILFFLASHKHLLICPADTMQGLLELSVLLLLDKPGICLTVYLVFRPLPYYHTWSSHVNLQSEKFKKTAHLSQQYVFASFTCSKGDHDSLRRYQNCSVCCRPTKNPRPSNKITNAVNAWARYADGLHIRGCLCSKYTTASS